MNMSKDDSLEKGNLNYIYKKQTEDERFLDKVIRAESKGTISDEQNLNDTSPKKKITKDEIRKYVMEQAKHYKRDDEKQQSKYADIAKVIPWFSEYKKQPISITRERIKEYLKYYKDLPNLIKLREQKLVSGKVKPESKTIEPNKLESLDFLDDYNINKLEFMQSVDYKLNEMIFYYTNLRVVLHHMKKYMFIGYQLLILKYYYNFNIEDLKKATNIENIEYMESILINYLYEKLLEENNDECKE